MTGARFRAIPLSLALVALAAFSLRVLLPFVRAGNRVVSPAFAETVDEIVVRGPREGFPLVFSLVEGRWTLVFDSDLRYPANGDRIAGLLTYLSERRRIRRLNPLDGWTYGVEGPERCEITLRSRSRSLEHSISFGSENADGRSRFARKDGDSAIIALDGEVSAWLDNATAPWLDHAPFAGIGANGVSRASLFARGSLVSLDPGAGLDRVVELVSGLSVTDITNIPVEPSFRVRLERGDTGVSVLAFASLDERYGIVTEESTGLSWIVPGDRLEEILYAFQHFSAM